MVLDRNPENYFAEVEQVTFSIFTNQIAMVGQPSLKQISQRLLQYPVLLIVLLTIIMIISHRRATCIVYLAWMNALVCCKILLAL